MIMKRIVVFLLMFVAISCKNSRDSKVTVAVAANMQYAMEEIVDKFESTYSVKVQTSSSSSGILTTQIRQGAPFDIFVSANMLYPNTLYAEGLASTTPKVYAYGALIMWTLEEGLNIDKGLESLLQSDVKKVAIANFDTAPYGIAALEAIKNASLYDSLKSKFIVGESIGQVNQYIQSKTVNLGITSKSVLYSPNVKIKGRSVDVDENLYTPISQGIVVLKNGKEKNLKNTKLFYDFMFSDEAKSILSNYGYNVN